MEKRTTVFMAATVAMFAVCVCGSQRATTISALSKAIPAIPTTPFQPEVRLVQPDNRIAVMTTTPFALTFDHEGMRHTYEYLLAPDPASTAPASGWFIETSGGIPVFYLEAGYVYVTHSSVAIGGGGGARTTSNEVTRPRVRTRRVLAQGEGTIMLVHALLENDRVFSLTDSVAVTSLKKNNTEFIAANNFRDIADDGSLGPQTLTAGDPPLAQFVASTITLATGLELQKP